MIEIEAMDTKGEKSSEVTQLAGKNSKSKDDESLIQKTSTILLMMMNKTVYVLLRAFHVLLI